MNTSRRQFLQSCGMIGASAMLAPAFAGEAPAACRKYHLSVSPDALQADPALLELAEHAGVTDVWLTGFLYGHWHYPLEKTRIWRERVEKLGMAAHLINVPLGHPGDSLGSISGNVPLTPPRHWRARRGAERQHICRHLAPSTGYGRKLRSDATDPGGRHQTGVSRRRFPPGPRPGVIGGCFCRGTQAGVSPPHRLQRNPVGANCWRPSAVVSLTPVLRAWVEFTCDQLTACFRAQQKARTARATGKHGHVLRRGEGRAFAWRITATCHSAWAS